jgi:signal transduction histidine kinase
MMFEHVGRVVDALKPMAKSSSIALISSIAITPILMIPKDDEKVLMQSILNIVDNLIQDFPSDTNVVVDVRKLGEELSIYVSDNGVVMNEVGVKAAREAFRRVEEGYTGSVDGIGLILANIFIELHSAE